MSTTSQPSAYPARCPHCTQPSGWPFSAGTCDRPGVIIVKLRCESCRHEWVADAPQPAMASVGEVNRHSRRSHRRHA